MKKTLLIAAAALIGASAFAAEVVSSANVVGYSTSIAAGAGYTLVSTAFISTNNTIVGLFGDFPTGSQVLYWDATLQDYVTLGKSRGGWTDGGTNVIERGSGVFVQLPAGSVSQEIIASGDVPSDGSFTNFTAAGGYTLMSYPYPSDVAFSNTALYAVGDTGDQISFWENGAYATYGKSRGGWEVGIATNTLKMGQAFFYKEADSTPSDIAGETQPYDLNN